MGKSHTSAYFPAWSATTGGGKVDGHDVDSSVPSQKAELLLQLLNSGSNAEIAVTLQTRKKGPCPCKDTVPDL